MSSVLLLVTVICAQAAPSADREASRKRLDRILREETNREGANEELEEWKRRLRERKAEPPPRHENRRPPERRRESSPDYSGGGGAGISAKAVFTTILILLAAVMLALAIYAVSIWVKNAKPSEVSKPKAKPKPGGAAPPVRREPDEWLAEARRLVAAGEYREAVRCLLLATMELLHRSRRIDYERARTNRECLGQFRGEASLRDRFASIVNLFDSAWYGGAPVGPAEYAAAEGLARELRQGVAHETGA